MPNQERRRHHAPVWLMGLANAVFGMYGGILAISVPQLLSARHVPESTIAATSAVVMSPGFWTFVFSPLLDVRFSRRSYSAFTAFAAAALLVVAMLNLSNLIILELSLLAGFFFANLYQSALAGWLSSITTHEQQNRLSVWVTIGNIGGGGIMAVATGELVHNLSPHAAAVLLGALIILPTAIFPWMQAPGPDRRLASESFARFFMEVVSLLRRREILIALLLFVAPAATFSLTNFLGGLGADFGATGHIVGLVGGVSVLLGVSGCLVFPLLDRMLPLRMLYLAIGVVGAFFTMALIVLPHTPAAFAVAMIGENVFQGLAITAATAIAFETIGRQNPLAATTYCLMISTFNIPITYMVIVDGIGYAHHGINGSYLTDAGLSLVACLLLGVLLLRQARRNRAAGLSSTVLSGTMAEG